MFRKMSGYTTLPAVPFAWPSDSISECDVQASTPPLVGSEGFVTLPAGDVPALVAAVEEVELDEVGPGETELDEAEPEAPDAPDVFAAPEVPDATDVLGLADRPPGAPDAPEVEELFDADPPPPHAASVVPARRRATNGAVRDSARRRHNTGVIDSSLPCRSDTVVSRRPSARTGRTDPQAPTGETQEEPSPGRIPPLAYTSDAARTQLVRPRPRPMMERSPQMTCPLQGGNDTPARRGKSLCVVP